MKEWKQKVEVNYCPHGCGPTTNVRPITDEEWEEEGEFLGTTRESTTVMICNKCGAKIPGGFPND